MDNVDFGGCRDRTDGTDGTDGTGLRGDASARQAGMDPSSPEASGGGPVAREAGMKVRGPYVVSIVEPVGGDMVFCGAREFFLEAAELAGSEARRMGAPCGIVKAGVVRWVVPVAPLRRGFGGRGGWRRRGLLRRVAGWVWEVVTGGSASPRLCRARAAAARLAGMPVREVWRG